MNQVPRRFVTRVTKSRWQFWGIEHVDALQPTNGLILVSNHRSFFDMYVASAALLERTRFVRELYYPVRTSFFYDNPLGSLVNFLMSGYAMWPPVFRDDRRHMLNAHGVRQMAYVLSRPGALLGIHPEGTRSRQPDPYTLGGARPGVGRLVEACHPNTLVLPFFIVGLSNDFVHEVRVGLSRRNLGPPIRIHFSPALRCADLRAAHSSPQAIADGLLGIVAQLGERDRSLAESATA
jgi:1-acyl-sn-glycerol-3-phosphate acyltransferase